MNKLMIAGFGLALSGLVLVQATAVAANTGEDSSMQLAKSVERFYGKSIEEVDRFLASTYGVKGPTQQKGSNYDYILPLKDPICGGLTVQTDSSRNVTGWETTTWDRNEQHSYGKACAQALKSQ